MRRRFVHPITWSAALALAMLSSCGKPRGSFEEVMTEAVRDYEAGEYVEAIALFKAAAEKDRERPEPSYYIGRCYMGLAAKQFREDDLGGALRYCDRAISALDASVGAFPGYSQALQAKADALRLKGMNAAALEIANWAAAYVGPQARMLILKGRQYAQAGDIDSAQLSFRQAISMEPKNAAAHAEMGLFYLRCGNESAAIESLKKAYELDPAAPGVVTALARLGAIRSVEPK